MRLPEKVKVGYRTYRIVPHGLDAVEHSGCIGYTNHHSGVIGCQDYGSKVECANTLLHETIHACLRVGDVELSDEDEEKVATIVANHLIGVCQTNPEVVRFILRNARAEE